MDFYVYDTFNMFSKINTNLEEKFRLNVEWINITENNAFWFKTNMVKQTSTINLQKPYVHLYDGIESHNNVVFKKPPFIVTSDNLYYDPQLKKVIVKGGILRGIKYQKKALFYGKTLPQKRTKITGNWIYDYGKNRLHFILGVLDSQIRYSEDNSKPEIIDKPKNAD